jgi:Ku70/Ku80 beta-barrel domain
MPRATWNGHLRLSLVSCPVYLSPATTETKRIRLNPINSETGNRVRQQLVDKETGEVVERHQVAKGYEHDRGQYMLIDDEELKTLQVESSKMIELTQFVERDEVDPVYLDAPYYVYPDGKLAVRLSNAVGPDDGYLSAGDVRPSQGPRRREADRCCATRSGQRRRSGGRRRPTGKQEQGGSR